MQTRFANYFCRMKNGFGLLLIVCSVACSNNNVENTVDNHQHLQLVEDLKETIAKYPDSAGLRLKLAFTYDSLQQYDNAIVQTDSLISKDSLNNGLWFSKAQMQEDNKDTAGAIISYKTAIRIYPSVEAQLSLANLLAENRNPDALIICSNVKKMSMGRETDANCSFIAGVYFARTGNAQKALAFFDKAINENYTLMEAYMEKGFLYFEAKNYQQAHQVFERAITIDNLYADAYYWKARTEEAMGSKADALLNFERAYGLDKSNTDAAKAIKRLQ